MGSVWGLDSQSHNIPSVWSCGKILSYFLVGGIPTPLKNMEVSWDYCSQKRKKTCSNQPTSFDMLSSIRVSGGGFSFDSDVKIGRLPMFFQCLENQIGQCTRFYLSQDHYYVQVYNYIYTADPKYYIIIYYHLYSYIH